MSSPLKRLFENDDVQAMLKGNDYQSINIVLSFSCALLYEASGYAKGGELMKVNISYFALLVEIYGIF